MKTTCFCSFVDQNYLPGFLALLKSIVINSADTLLPFVVLHDDDLSPKAAELIADVYPTVFYRRIGRAPYKKFIRGDRGNYLVEKAYYILDAFLIDDFDRVITLDTDMIVRSSLRGLLDVHAPVAAVEAYYENLTGEKLNSGLLVLNRDGRGAEVFKRLCALGESGDYELDKHDQGILTAHLNGDYQRLSFDYNFVKRRIRNKPCPASVKILHFTGSSKPWAGSEAGYEKAEAEWHAINITPAALWAKVAAEDADKRDIDAYFYFYQRLLWSKDYNRDETVRFVSSAIASNRMGYIDGALDRDPLTPGKRLVNILLYKGILARAKGKPDEAQYWLEAAFLTDGLAQRCLTELAELYWLTGRYKDARWCVTRAIALEPTDRRAVKLEERIALGEDLEAKRSGARTATAISHAAFYMTPKGNAGDYLVPESVRWALGGSSKPTNWAPWHVHQLFDQTAATQVNRTRALVIGGGGLFIPDTAANLVSGWQWFASKKAIAAVDVPILMFAVGYNVFYGQDNFIAEFDDNLAELVDRAKFVGIRNHGSIRRLKQRLPSELRGKVEYQPCPTTVTSFLRPDLFGANGQSAPSRPFVALNCAYDRKDARFGAKYSEFLSEMAEMILGIRSRMEVVYYSHTVLDEQFVIDIAKSHNIILPVERLNHRSGDEVVQLYTAPALAIGMRGHASMIPFGCGTPILSLISHPKMGYFLEDTNLEDWGVDIATPGFGSIAMTIALGVLDDLDRSRDRVQNAQRGLWDITVKNVEKCRALLA